ncbi:bifunctional NAD(P)H-hydrate repair enzyme [Rubrobacter xylanophilus]|uniref:Bifunctional NAD(P)H-hydrate repair enzyme n=1 Tax=Rubrobacter xylanophilus TaxID=49319 RepID=A0A510HG67_9ACTN|nr:NAD(P)H-hydrate dehydratase [Rubrobacter xylanophilus]BBL78225.1 bifunctional NAD(P)H-hydrate repair enzyme [Rubrobacter xylanophilus]
MRLYTAEEMGSADRAAQEMGITGRILMERAGVGMATLALERFSPRRAVAVCGGGNNGGDGFVVARELHRAGVEVEVVASKETYRGDPEANLRALRALGIRVVGPEGLEGVLSGAELVVDALLGTGFSGEVREREAAMIRQINASPAPVLAVDVPSGVDGSTGEVRGAAVRADLTVCAHAIKVGCVVSPGREHAGRVAVVDIGIPPGAEVEPSVVLNDAASLAGLIPRTAEPAHKYSAGALLVVAGSRAMTGAAVMTVAGAQRAGCGIVFLVTAAGAAPLLDARLTEAIVEGAPEDAAGHMGEEALDAVLGRAGRASAVVVGPGLGVGEGGRRLVEGILREVEAPVLLDADAITNLAGSGALARREAPAVITPHAGELGRIMGAGAREISASRLRCAREAARRHRCCVLLKGSDTIVVEGDRAAVNPTGHVALATAGTGDVLSGVIGALLSRGVEPYDAARAGAWAHGRAARLWLEETGWPAESLIATDLLSHLPRAFAELLGNSPEAEGPAAPGSGAG